MSLWHYVGLCSQELQPGVSSTNQPSGLPAGRGSSEMRVFTSALASIIVLTSIASVHAQSVRPTVSQPSASASVPRLIRYSGVFQPADGQPTAPVEVVTVSIYAEQ